MVGLIDSSGDGWGSGGSTPGGGPGRLTAHWRPGQTRSEGGEKAAPHGLTTSDRGYFGADVLCVEAAGRPLRLLLGRGCSAAPKPSPPTHLLMNVPPVVPHRAQGRLVEQAAALAALQQTSGAIGRKGQGDDACRDLPPELPTPRISDARPLPLSSSSAAGMAVQRGSGSMTPGAPAAAADAPAGTTLAAPAGAAAAGPTGKGKGSCSTCSSRREFSLSGRQFSSINRVASAAGHDYVTRRAGKRRRHRSDERRWRAQREASGHPTSGSATSAPRVTVTAGLPPGWPARQLLMQRSQSQGRQRQQEWSPRQLAPITGPASAQFPATNSSPPSLLGAAEAALQAGLGHGLINVAAWVAASLASASGAGDPMGPDAAVQRPAASAGVILRTVVPAHLPLPAAPLLLVRGRAPAAQQPGSSAAGVQSSVVTAPRSAAGGTSQACSCRRLKPGHGHMPGCFPCNPISALARLLGG